MISNDVEIYVRSSPLGGVGIHWRNITKPDQPREDPSILKKKVINKPERTATVNSLINETKPAIVLARYDKKILLEVVGLEADKQRSAQLGRRISEILLWVGDANKEVETHLKNLAVCTLFGIWNSESDFLQTIRKSIHFDGQDAFKADLNQFRKVYVDAAQELDILQKGIRALDADFSPSVWSTSRNIVSEEGLISLLNQIKSTPLPESQDPIVIIAELKGEPALPQLFFKGNVWEAPLITETPTSEIETYWPEEEEGQESEQLKKYEFDWRTKQRWRRRIAIVVLTLVTLMILAILLGTLSKTKVVNLSPLLTTSQLNMLSEKMIIPDWEVTR